MLCFRGVIRVLFSGVWRGSCWLWNCVRLSSSTSSRYVLEAYVCVLGSSIDGKTAPSTR